MSRITGWLAASLLLLSGSARALSNLDPAEAIAAEIRTHYLGSARACYQRGRKLDPDLEGRLELELTVGVRGRVTRARVVRSQLGAGVGDCLAAAARSWSFHRSSDRRPVTVTYPFVFATARDASP